MIRQVILDLPSDTIIVTGAQRSWDSVTKEFFGADYLAGMIARNLGFEVREYPADWARYGRSAGPHRNQQMLDEEHPDEVIGFKYKTVSKGTDNMLSRARKAGIKTTTYMYVDGVLTKLVNNPSVPAVDANVYLTSEDGLFSLDSL